MNTILFITLVILCKAITGFGGELEKPTAAQMDIFDHSLKPFLVAYYHADYETEWELGKVAYSNPPYNFRSKGEFLAAIKSYEKKSCGDTMVLSREIHSLSLNWVYTLPRGDEMFHVTAMYKETRLDTKTNHVESCELIGNTLFHIDMEEEEFDQFVAIEDRAFLCYKGQAM